MFAESWNGRVPFRYGGIGVRSGAPWNIQAVGGESVDQSCKLLVVIKRRKSVWSVCEVCLSNADVVDNGLRQLGEV